MATLDFLPFADGTVLSADILNRLVQAIIDGTIFSPTAITIVPGLISTMDSRVTTLESSVSTLQSLAQTISNREQLVLSAGQSVINLAHVPSIDSELVFYNGKLLTRDDAAPVGTRDYSIDGSTITLEPTLSTAVVDGDLLVVVYRYEV